MHSQYLHAAAQQGLRQPGPYDGERALKTIHVGGIGALQQRRTALVRRLTGSPTGGLGETITENDVADFFGQQGAPPRLCTRLDLTPPPTLRVGEVTAVRISGRFCWVEFSDARAAQAALECEPYSHARSASLTFAQAGRHDDGRAPLARVAEQVRHPQQRLEKTGAQQRCPSPSLPAHSLLARTERTLPPHTRACRLATECLACHTARRLTACLTAARHPTLRRRMVPRRPTPTRRTDIRPTWERRGAIRRRRRARATRGHIRLRRRRLGVLPRDTTPLLSWQQRPLRTLALCKCAGARLVASSCV